MIKPVLKMGEPRLLAVSKPVPDEWFGSARLDGLITDLLDTMRGCNGAGLAAPQIGEPWRVVVFGFETNSRYPEVLPIPQTILINPVLTPLTTETEAGWEGCLSVPGLRGMVPRFKRLRYTGMDFQGRVIDRTVDGFHARVVQHECDHLDGVLFPMRMTDFTRFGFTDVLFPELGA